MKAVREIKEWVLLSAGVQPHLASGFPALLERAVRDRYPGMDVEVSFVPAGNGGGPGSPWSVTGGADPAQDKRIEVHLFAVEKHMAAEAARRVFGQANPHPEDPSARICPSCREGVIRETGKREDACCDRCGEPW